MFQVDIPAAFAMGQVLAMVGRKSLKMGHQSTYDRFLLWTNWYVSLIMGPTGLFLLVGWPGWETMYKWSWVENPQFHSMVALFYIAFLMMIVVLGNAGFMMSYGLLRRNRDGVAKTIMVLSILLALAPFLDFNATLHIGTYQTYHAGTAPLVFGTSFIMSFFGIMLFWVIGSIAAVILVHIEDKFRQHQLAQ